MRMIQGYIYIYHKLLLHCPVGCKHMGGIGPPRSQHADQGFGRQAFSCSRINLQFTCSNLLHRSPKISETQLSLNMFDPFKLGEFAPVRSSRTCSAGIRALSCPMNGSEPWAFTRCFAWSTCSLTRHSVYLSSLTFGGIENWSVLYKQRIVVAKWHIDNFPCSMGLGPPQPLKNESQNGSNP